MRHNQNFTPACTLLLLALLFMGAINKLYAQTTWTGALGTAWNTAGNWSAGIPDAADDVTIPNVTNKPVISAAGAVAKSVTVQTDGLLTINAQGVLSINGSAVHGLVNHGTLENNGIINIGNTSGPAQYGIQNVATFNNNTGASINMDRVPYAIVNSDGMFTNTGTITVGNASLSSLGIHNLADFSNSGVINIKRVYTGIYCAYYSTFNNYGTVRIGEDTAIYLINGDLNPVGLFKHRGGILKGTGIVSPPNFVNSGGTLSPGYSPGKMTFYSSSPYHNNEDFTNSFMEMEVNDSGTAGVNYDQVLVQGEAILGGMLKLSINMPAVVGTQVTLISARSIVDKFLQVTGLLPGWTITYYPNSVVLSYDYTNEWTGAFDFNWHNPANWSTHGVPHMGSSVIIPAWTNYQPVIFLAAAVAHTVYIAPGTKLDVSTSLTTFGSKTFNGVRASVYNKGTLSVTGTLNISKN